MSIDLQARIYGLALRCTGRAAWASIPAGDNPLRDLEADLRRRYPGVAALEPADLADGVRLFDVRGADEYGVSHLAGAIRVRPRSTFDELMRAAGADALQGKTAVFYCAVGVRSARLIDRLQHRLHDAGCVRAANLSGGVFRWHNEGRPLFCASGGAERVHPFNRHWARFVRPWADLRS